MNIFEHYKQTLLSFPKMRILLPEGEDSRILSAANALSLEGVVDIVLLGKREVFEKNIVSTQYPALEDMHCIDPETSTKKEIFAERLYHLRHTKGLTQEQAKTRSLHPLYFGALMLSCGEVDGCVAGAQYSSAEVARAALQIIRTAENAKSVSGAFIMQKGKEVYLFADCALNPNPSAQELAAIAITSGKTTQALLAKEPKIALISFSTKGSAEHPLVTKVIEATIEAKKQAPHMCIEGELQIDAALVPAISKKKAPGNVLAGPANTFIFPDLNSGNIAYKLLERLGGFQAIGPILQGLSAPMNDLSRGCSSEDIQNMILLTAMQALVKKEEKK